MSDSYYEDLQSVLLHTLSDMICETAIIGEIGIDYENGYSTQGATTINLRGYITGTIKCTGDVHIKMLEEMRKLGKKGKQEALIKRMPKVKAVFSFR